MSTAGTVPLKYQPILAAKILAGRRVTIHVADTTLTINLPDGDTRTIQRTTTQPDRRIKTH